MLFDGISHQLPDIDPEETAEWLDSFDEVVDIHGRSRKNLPAAVTQGSIKQAK